VSLELVVDARQNGIWLALLRDGKLIELHQEQGNNDFSVGDIYLGKVRKVVPSLNAAFVDVGYEKDAFLHYLDLGPQALSLNKFSKGVQSDKQNTSNLMYFKLEPDIPKDGKIGTVLVPNQQILVQIAKEPISMETPIGDDEDSHLGDFIEDGNTLAPSEAALHDSMRDVVKDVLDSLSSGNGITTFF